MGWLGKFIEVDETKQGNVQVDIDELEQSLQGLQPQTTTNVDMDDLLGVDQIYASYNLSDMDKSILKVNEFLKALPDSLPTDIKRQSVLSILTASKLELSDLLDDASQRTIALTQIQSGFTQETNDSVNSAEREIKDLETKIDELKQKINDRKKLQENQVVLIQEEIKRIEEIVKFVTPS